MDGKYQMSGAIPCKIIEETDLGITISADTKVSAQYGIIASNGCQILWMIRRNLTYKRANYIFV